MESTTHNRVVGPVNKLSGRASHTTVRTGLLYGGSLNNRK